MNILSIAILVFMVLESANVALLYFMPASRKGNAMGAFDAFERSKADPEVHALVKYLVNWVAGTKLIFIALLLVILVAGTATTRVFAVVALILSILSYFWRLHPAIKAMDAAGQITPKGYSRTLGLMIAGFVVVFAAALVSYMLLPR